MENFITWWNGLPQRTKYVVYAVGGMAGLMLVAAIVQ